MVTTDRLRPGDRVKYARTFLRSIACYTGPLPFARGTVTRLDKVGPLFLATVAWDSTEAPPTVNLVNLRLAADPEHASV